MKKCKVREEKVYNYGTLMRLSDFPKMQPTGYLVRSSFYVFAHRDAHVVFSPNRSPDKRDNVYEIRMLWPSFCSDRTYNLLIVRCYFIYFKLSGVQEVFQMRGKRLVNCPFIFNYPRSKFEYLFLIIAEH